MAFMVVPLAVGGAVLATGGTGALSTLITYKVKQNIAKKNIKTEIEEADVIQHDEISSGATIWREKGNFFLEKSLNDTSATSFLQMFRYKEASECFSKGLDEAHTGFDRVEIAQCTRALAITKWKQTHALKIFTSVPGPLFREEIQVFKNSFIDAINFFVEAEKRGRETMNAEWCTAISEEYKTFLKDIFLMTKLPLMTHQGWIDFMFELFSYMAEGDPYKCDMHYKIAHIQADEKDFNGALETLKKCIRLIEEASDLGPSTHFAPVVIEMYTRLIREILLLADLAKSHKDETLSLATLAECERLVQDVLNRELADNTADIDELREKISVKLCTPVWTLLANLRTKLLTNQLKHVILNRRDVFSQALELYKDPDIIKYKLRISFEGEDGIDEGGLTKEFFSLFWNEYFMQYCVGDELKVPKVIPDHTEECSKIMLTIGKVLTHQILLTGEVPASLSPVFLATVFMSNCTKQEQLLCSCISHEMLLSNILLFVNADERKILRSVLSGEIITEETEDNLLDLYDRIGMQSLPRECSIKEQLIQMAQSELIVKPKYFAEALHMGVPEKAKRLFWNLIKPEQFQAMHDSLTPTQNKVASLLSFCICDDPSLRELEILGWVEDIVRELTRNELLAFLQFVTASESMPDIIGVVFNGTVGWEKVPRAHTCGNVLELSVHYESKEELKTILLNVLQYPGSHLMLAQ